MLTNELTQQIYKEFNSSTTAFLCNGSPNFRLHWRASKVNRDELRILAQRFIDTTPVSILADHVNVFHGTEEVSERAFLFCPAETSDDRDIRLAFLDWLRQQDFLP